MSETVLDRIVSCLQAALAHNPNVQAAPVALLWPDQGEQWEPVIDRIGERLPLVSLGDYDPAARRGPAYWLRCVVAGTIDAGLPEGVPIVYLPGVSRLAIRAADGCPPRVAPIAELQYRGQWFSHRNNRDWTVRGLLSNRERGLGLEIADDAVTQRALLLALDRLVEEPIERVQRQLVDADYLLELIDDDPVLTLLRWIDDPADQRGRLGEAGWTAFAEQCRGEYGFDPAAEGELSAARRLALREGPWAKVWKRFAENAGRYPGVVGRLRQAKPQELLLDPGTWPQDNEEREGQLRRELAALESSTAEEAREEVLRLEREHGPRRAAVWADLDQAPLAFALEHLVALAEVAKRPLAAESADALLADYAERGWRADDAVLRALAAAPGEADRRAVSAAVAPLYRPWLDAGARALQEMLAGREPYRAAPPVEAEAGKAILFVDGLRLDLARRVEARLEETGLEVEAELALASLPTVTATAKPALVPVEAGEFGPGDKLQPTVAASGAQASTPALRRLMEERGVQVLGAAETGDPARPAWAETGDVDHRGHDEGTGLADTVEEILTRAVRRIRQLLDAGWTRVEIVTDHGWMLVPGGMPKVELPPATVAVKKGRCARLKEGAAVELPTVPWHWDPEVRIALAPGAACFEAGKEYEHGGVSPQECAVPRLRVSATAPSTTRGPELTGLKWLGLLCRLEFRGAPEGTVADLRESPADPATSLVERTKPAVGGGRAALLVPDEEREGARAHLVLVAEDRILVQREVVVGSNR